VEITFLHEWDCCANSVSEEKAHVLKYASKEKKKLFPISSLLAKKEKMFFIKIFLRTDKQLERIFLSSTSSFFVNQQNILVEN
jgi:hypothetical protein